MQWLSHPDDKDLPFDERRPHPKYPNRRQDMLDSAEFVKALYNSDIKHIAIENPVGLLSSRWRKPDQIIQPYMFGDEATKTTCLWLKNLPLILPTNIVGKGERTVFSSGKSHPMLTHWHWPRQNRSDKHYEVKHFQEWLKLSQNNGARYFNHRASTRAIGY
jgi:hypothetical protein